MKRSREPPPFASDYNDEFETPKLAYEDISPALSLLASKLKKEKGTLSCYDPYYCQGTMKTHLASLGYSTVRNDSVDCYKEWEKREEMPPFDVVITNPPFSGDHKEKILSFCLSSGKPYFLLLPNYCATKQWFKDKLAASKQQPFYVIPSATYNYTHPEGTGKADAPFESIWVCSGGEVLPNLLGQWRHSMQGGKLKVTLVPTVEELVRTLGGVTLGLKRPNPKQRKRLKALKGGGGGVEGGRAGGGVGGGGGGGGKGGRGGRY